MKEVLEPVLARDALLVSDANRCYPPVAAALDVPHESINVSAGERIRGALHIQTVNSRHSQIKGFLRARPRHRHQVPRQLSEVVPSHRTRRPAIAKSLPGGGDDETMPTNCGLSQNYSWFSMIPVTSMSYEYVFVIAQTLKNLSISDQGQVSVNPGLIDGNKYIRPELLILTHSSYFFNISVTNKVVDKSAAFALIAERDKHVIAHLGRYVAPF